MGGIVISPNPRKTKVHIDFNGNEVVPFTKQIIKTAEEEYRPTKQEIEKVINLPETPAPVSALSIQQQIEQAEKHLVDLKVQKKVEIERMKSELAKLENS